MIYLGQFRELLNSSSESIELQRWRERILQTIYIIGVSIGVIMLIPMSSILLNQGKGWLLLVELAITAWGLAVILLRQRLSFKIRAYSALSLIYLTGLAVFWNLGPYSGGVVWIFAFSVFCGLLFGMRVGLLGLFINLLTLVVLGYLINDGFFPWSTEVVNAKARWFGLAMSFILLNALMVTSASVLARGLATALNKEKDAKHILWSEKERFKTIFDSIGDLICTHDLQGRIMSVNPTAVEKLGLPVEQLVGVPIATALPPELRDKFDSWYMKDLLANGYSNGIMKVQLFNGNEMFLEYHNTLVKPDDGEPYITGVARDITERIQSEKKLEALQAQLQQSQKMEAIGTLAGGIAHDFNNILTTIIGYGELAQRSAKAGDDNTHQLDHLISAAERARDLVKQLLTFSRKSETDLKPVDLNQVLAHAVEILEHTLPKMMEIRTTLAEDLEPIRADVTQMEQVIMNLAGNASDAMPEGGYLVFETKAVTIQEEDQEEQGEMPAGRYALLTAIDSGVGMDQETQSQIFNPFFTTKEIGKGTGLGLSTLYGIVKEHGGEVFCQSHPGSGTTFEIYLPIAELHKGDLTQSQEPYAKSAPGGDETILLVEDEEAIREMGSELLTAMGYRVIGVSSGEEALKAYKNGGPRIDLVVLDLGMPGMGGHKCLKELLAFDPSAKVLIASGYSADGKVKDTLRDGAAGYIAKPFRRDDLLKALRDILDT